MFCWIRLSGIHKILDLLSRLIAPILGEKLSEKFKTCIALGGAKSGVIFLWIRREY